MKHIYLSVFILMSVAFSTYSQEINLGPRATALGNTGVALQEVWSLQSNQAGLTDLKNPVASISYRNNFLNPELSTQAAVVAYPFKQNVVGFSLQSYGFSAYSEQKLGFTYAKGFGNTLSVSLNFNVHQIKIEQYGSDRTISVEAGLQYKPSEKLIIGAHVANPYRASYDSEVNAVLPVSIEFGAAYKFTDKLLLNSCVVKEISSLTDLRFGLEYSIANAFAVRGGIAVNSFKQFAGFGYKYQQIMVDAAVSVDPHLGYSPQLALSYEF